MEANKGEHMKKLYFKYGTMGCSKSAQALMTAFNYNQKGYEVLLLKPKIDTRDLEDGKIVIHTRIGLSRECVAFSATENLYELAKKNSANVVIVDEAQFCTKEQIDQLKELTCEDKVVICYGLLKNFKGELFEGSKRLVELSESLMEIKSICKCGNKATMNARFVNGVVVTEGDEIVIGGDEAYESMCYSCFKKYQNKNVK